jgi:hypothetical protein
MRTWALRRGVQFRPFGSSGSDDFQSDRIAHLQALAAHLTVSQLRSSPVPASPSTKSGRHRLQA